MLLLSNVPLTVCIRPSACFWQLSELINSAKLTDDDRLRLVMLFAVKYERDGRPQVCSVVIFDVRVEAKLTAASCF